MEKIIENIIAWIVGTFIVSLIVGLIIFFIANVLMGNSYTFIETWRMGFWGSIAWDVFRWIIVSINNSDTNTNFYPRV